LHYLKRHDFTGALHIAGANDKMNNVNFSFDPEEKYTFGAELCRWFFCFSLFWNRSITSWSHIWEIGKAKAKWDSS
jgi:hypothetical protein